MASARSRPPVTASAAPPRRPVSSPLLGILPLALLGGLILNLMPCVLPVLSLKLLGAGRAMAGGRRAPCGCGFLASAAGSARVLPGAGRGAWSRSNAAGVAVGWGMQFQQPLFLIGMVALLDALRLQSLGLLRSAAAAAAGVALGSAGEGRLVIGNFAAGAFATLLATPCSAPFLGTAIGFALAAGPVEIVAIFLALGIGLAAPYLLVAALPRLAPRLPRPGRWMITLRRVLGLALAATAVWLVSVLVAQIGVAAALAVGALIAAARRGAAAVARAVAAARSRRRRCWPRRSLRPRCSRAAPPAARGRCASGSPSIARRSIAWSSDGQVVFVDVTADWCLTCKVNERLVLDTPAVPRRLAAPGIVAMRADWTRPSDVIAAYLRGFGRYGIPFNAVYGPAAPHGVALPEILTPGRGAGGARRGRRAGSRRRNGGATGRG